MTIATSDFYTLNFANIYEAEKWETSMKTDALLNLCRKNSTETVKVLLKGKATS